MLGLVGPNGSGKTTLLKVMLGIIRPTSGKVLVNGEELSGARWKEFKRSVGYMPERVSFYDNLTGMETLRLFARIKNVEMSRMYEFIKRILSEDALLRKVGGYSKGMRQRLNLAQALLNDPDLLILDEPTSGLDPVVTKEFYDILNGVGERKRLTVILSSHILGEIEDRIDRIAILKNGLLAAKGTLEELYTSLRLPLRISIAVISRDETLEDVLRKEGASEIEYKEGHLLASVPRESKIRILSVLFQRRNGFTDLSIREPSLEEVFFGVH